MTKKIHLMTTVGLLALVACGRQSINEVSARASGLKTSGDRITDGQVAMAPKSENVSEYECPPEEVAGSNLASLGTTLNIDSRCGSTTNPPLVVVLPTPNPSTDTSIVGVGSGTGGTSEPPTGGEPDEPTTDMPKVRRDPLSNISSDRKTMTSGRDAGTDDLEISAASSTTSTGGAESSGGSTDSDDTPKETGSVESGTQY